MTETASKTIGVKESSGAEIYRKCQEEVLKRLEKSNDNLGRSMKWKAIAIREDLAAHRDTAAVDWFTKEVISLAERYL